MADAAVGDRKAGAVAEKGRTIRDFGEQWSHYGGNDGFYGSVELLQDMLGPLVPLGELEGARVADIGSGTGRIVRMLVDAGASSITVLIPQGVGCSLSVDAALSSKRFPGFTKNEDGLYETDNYRTADRRIEITIDVGVSSLKVERY